MTQFLGRVGAKCMMWSTALEFWMIMLVVVDLLLIILFIILMRQLKAARAMPASSDVELLPQILEPLLKEAERISMQFETQLKEKQRLVRKLNEHLDSRIISLNLLLNRADVCLASHGKESMGKNTPQRHVYDLQQEIIALAEKGLGSQEIANRMGISEGEVMLVLELKRKFMELEKNG